MVDAPVQAAVGQAQFVVDWTTSAETPTPSTETPSVLTLACELLTPAAPFVSTVELPTDTIPPPTLVPTLDKLMSPPALGNGPVAKTPVVTAFVSDVST